MEQPKGEKVKEEKIKEGSNYLLGTIVEELTCDSSHVSAEDHPLLKFHGVYEQDDRDLRSQLKREGKELGWVFMVRSKIPAGELTADQYLIYDDISSRFANNTIRITTRQDFQLHGVLKKNLKETIATINKALVTTLGACGDVERNVMACPAPLNDLAHRTIQAHAKRLSDELLPKTPAYHEIWVDGEKVLSTKDEEVEPLYGKAYLPRKFKSGLSLPEDNCIDVHTQDIGMIAILEDHHLRGFDVLVGGGMGMHHGIKTTFPRLGDPLGFAAPEQLVEVVKKIVGIQRDYGDRTNRKHARMKYLINEWGIPKFRAELERRLGYSLQDYLSIEHFEVEDHLGWHEQGDGKWFLGISVENGRIKDEGDLRLKSGLRKLIETFRPGVRLTPQQNVILADIDDDKRSEIESILKQYGIKKETEISNARRFSMACPALPTCGLAITEAERVLPGIIDQFEKVLEELGLQNERISIRMVGCPNGCTRPFVAEIGFVGKSVGKYNIYVGGNFEGTRLNQEFALDVRLEDLVKTLYPLLVFFKSDRLEGESFGNFCHRKGIEALKEL